MQIEKISSFVVRNIGLIILCLVLSACSGTATQTIHNPTTTVIPEAPPPTQTPVTPVPYPARPADRPTPYFSPTPVIPWNADVIEVSWDVYGAISQPEWLSNTIAKLASYDGGYSAGYVTVDISQGREARAVAASVDSDWKIYSPHRTFVIECSGGMRMYHVNDHSIVSETALLPSLYPRVECSSLIRWAEDESIASFVTSDNAVYVWRSDGTEPRKVMDHASSVVTAWSPDSLRLAIEKSETDTHIGTVDVIDTGGQILQEFQFRAGGDGGAILGWLTDEVLASYSRSTTWFYKVSTGQFLFSWTSMPWGNEVHQYPQVSPDGRWAFYDQGDERRESAVDPSHSIVRKEYILYDIQEQSSTTLLNYWGDYLSYAGWNADSSILYVVSRPAESVSTSEPSTPFGLLGYDVQTHQYELLFKDAVQVVFNTDKSWAFVVFAATDEEGQLGLDGGLWQVGSTTLQGRWRISNQMVYQDPVLDSFFYAFPGPISVAWSHDSKYVAVCDGFGQVKLLSVDSPERILTDEMPGSRVALQWSPDDRHLLVLTDYRAWIVSITNP